MSKSLLNLENNFLQPSWRTLLKPKYFSGVIVFSVGIILYSINEFSTASILPSVVKDIGGERYFSWATSLCILSSAISSILIPHMLISWELKKVYLYAVAIQTIGCFFCMFSHDFSTFLFGRIFQGLSCGWFYALAYVVIHSYCPKCFGRWELYWFH